MTVCDQKIFSHTDLCLYLDFYGQLLTAHAREILELYYCEDMSLAEIAENLGITRQAVHDRLRRGTGQLAKYEKALGSAAKFRIMKEYVRQALDALDNGRTELVRSKLIQMESGL